MAFYPYILLVLAASTVVLADPEATCECALFKQPTPDTTKETPIASKSPKFDFECTEEGKKNCLKMCIALAGASKEEEGPQKICELVTTTTEPFVPMVFYKACNDDFYTTTGIQSNLKVCCNEKTLIPCP